MANKMTIKLKNNIKNYSHRPGKYESYSDQPEEFFQSAYKAFIHFPSKQSSVICSLTPARTLERSTLNGAGALPTDVRFAISKL